MRANLTPEQRLRAEALAENLSTGLRGPSTTEILRAAVEAGLPRLEDDDRYVVAQASADAAADWLADNGFRLGMSQLDALHRLLWYSLLTNEGGISRKVRLLLLSFGVNEGLALEAAGVTSVNLMEVM